jgi:hypothetical protein
MNLNLPKDFPKVTLCWFCQKDIQNHSGAWQIKESPGSLGRESIRIRCFRHVPENEIIYSWIKEDGVWIMSSIILNYKNFIIYSIIQAPRASNILVDGASIMYERRKNADLLTVMELPPYWILQSNLQKINQKILTYSILK